MGSVHEQQDQPPYAQTLRKFELALRVVGIASLTLLVILWTGRPAKDTPEAEAFKALLGILGTAVVGQVIALLLAQYLHELRAFTEVEAFQRGRAAVLADDDRKHKLELAAEERRRLEAEAIYCRGLNEARQAQRKEVLQKLVRCYSDAKRIRRLMRAEAISPSYGGEELAGSTLVLKEPYLKHMRDLLDVELTLEELFELLEVSEDLFPGSRDLAKFVDEMASYLNKVIREYLAASSRFGELHALLLEEVSGDHQRLKAFLGPSGLQGGDDYPSFVEGFTGRYEDVMTRMQSVVTSGLNAIGPNTSAGDPSTSVAASFATRRDTRRKPFG